jgi:hypothetical protein
MGKVHATIGSKQQYVGNKAYFTEMVSAFVRAMSALGYTHSSPWS